MYKNFSYILWEQLFDKMYEFFPSAALLTNKGDVINIKPHQISDIGTLPIAIQTCNKYLPLKSGDVVILNDPYSGGSTLNCMVLVYALPKLKPESSHSSPFLLGVQLPFKPQVRFEKNIENEGLRIPPTPLVVDGEINKSVLNAISNHPLAPLHFNLHVLNVLDHFEKIKTHFLNCHDLLEKPWSNQSLSQYFKTSYQLMREKINELPFNNSFIEFKLDDGTQIKLKLEVDEKKITFDFASTESSELIFLTDAATYGACFGALCSIFNQKIPFNRGTFNALEVIAPKGSAVNAQYPSPVYLGITEGASQIANEIVRAIGLIDNTRKIANSSVSQSSLELIFSHDLHFFETLKGGSGASLKTDGTHGAHLWKQNYLDNRIEEIEQTYPIKVNSYAFRTNSGGQGKRAGGDGTTMTVTLLKPALFRWYSSDIQKKIDGKEGGRHGTEAEVLYKRHNSKDKEAMDPFGEIQVQAGDIITVNSAGGGGFGND